MSTPASDACRLVGAHGLPHTLPRPAAPLADGEWLEFVRAVEQHRLSGLAVAAARSGALPITSVQLADLADRDEVWQSHSLRVEALLLRSAAVLDDAGIDWRLFKGPALSHLGYADPSQRVFGDLDLVVAPGCVLRAAAALQHGLGAERLIPEVRRGFDDEFAKDVPLRVSGLEVDLHRTVAAGPFGLRLPVDDILRDPVSVTIGGHAIPTLSCARTAVQVACNAALGDVPPRLGSLRDLAQLTVGREVATTPDILAVARHWHVEAPLQHAIASAWDRFGLDRHHPLAQWASAHRASRADQRLLAASTTERRSYRRAFLGVAAVAGARPRARYLSAVLLPQRSYLEARSWSRRGHVIRGVRALTRRA